MWSNTDTTEIHLFQCLRVHERRQEIGMSLSLDTGPSSYNGLQILGLIKINLAVSKLRLNTFNIGRVVSNQVVSSSVDDVQGDL